MAGQLRVVDLQHETGVDDGPVFLVQGVGEGDPKFLIGLVELVSVPAGKLGRRHGRHESLLARDLGDRRFQIVDVARQRFVSLVGDRASAHPAGPLRPAGRPWHLRGPSVILGKGEMLARPRPGAFTARVRPWLDAGLVLQIDDPQLASHYTTHPELDVTQCRNWANTTVEALNHALAGIPLERVRYHTCYGINMGPRVHDLELKHIVDIMLRIGAGAYSFEAGNPRHEHEWRVWEEVKLPAGKALIPGVITHGSNFVEHPEAIAQRIGRFANVVGRENVIAGADCGFASFSTTCEVHPTIVWAKLASLAEGARLATKELWGRA